MPIRSGDARTLRQLAIIESIAYGEVRYSTHFDGFYFNRRLQLQLAAEDQSFLKTLFSSGEIWHKPLGESEFEVCLGKGEDG